MRKALVLLLAALVCGPALVAQAPAGERRTIAVSVLDNDGKTVTGLTASNFRGTFRGQPVTILSAELDTNPRRIAILVDTSAGTPQVQTSWALVWTIAEDLISQLALSYKIAFLMFAENLHGRVEFVGGRERLLNLLQDAKMASPRGSSAVYDALFDTSQDFTPAQTGDAIILISDGDDNASRKRMKDVERKLVTAHMRVFAIWTNPTRLRASSRQIANGKERLAQLANSTGGLFLEPPDDRTGNLKAQLGLTYEAIRDVYRLEVQVQPTIDKPRQWELALVDAEAKEIKALVVAYPKLLVPASKP